MDKALSYFMDISFLHAFITKCVFLTVCVGMNSTAGEDSFFSLGAEKADIFQLRTTWRAKIKMEKKKGQVLG